jgi:hypothetical protein
MGNRTHTAIMFLMVTIGLAGCSPTAPMYVPLNRGQTPESPQPPSPLPPVALRGTVHDTAMKPLAGVEVQAWSGPEVYVMSDESGEFSIPAAYDSADVFYAMKEGYAGQSRTLASGLNFVLETTVTKSTMGPSSSAPSSNRTRTRGSFRDP